MSKKLFVTLFASVAVAFIGWNVLNKPEVTTAAPRATQQNLASNGAGLAALSQDNSGTKSDAVDKKVGLAQQMLTATNMRAFAELAKQQPEKGGVFLAEVATSNCKQARIVTDQKSFNVIIEAQVKRYPGRAKHVASAMAAANQLSARCQGFTSEDYERLQLYTGKVGEGRAPDPLVEAMKSISSEDKVAKRTLEQRRDDLELFAKYGLFEHSVGLTTLGRHEGDSYVVYFEGQPWGGVQKYSFMAAQEAVKRAAMVENPQSFYWLEGCAYELACEVIDTQDKLIDLVLDDRSLYGRGKVDRQVMKAEMTQLIPKLQRAVKQGDFSAFALPPKSAG